MSWDKDSTDSVGEAKKQLQDMQAIKEDEGQIKGTKKKTGRRLRISEWCFLCDLMFCVIKNMTFSEKISPCCQLFSDTSCNGYN